MIRNQLLQHRYQLGLHLPGTPKLAAAGPVLLPDPHKLLIVLQEEAQPLIAHVHIQISPQLLLQLLGLLPSREGVDLDLPLDFLIRVRQEDGRVSVAAAHLALRALQRREELGVYQRRLSLHGVMTRHQLVRHIAREPEVRILIDGARDEARQRCRVGFFASQDFGEGAAEGRRRLYGGEGRLADVGRAIEAEDSVDLVDGDGLPNAHNAGIHPPHVLQVREEEGLISDEIAGDNVLGILRGEVGERVEVVARLVGFGAGAISRILRGILSLEEELLLGCPFARADCELSQGYGDDMQNVKLASSLINCLSVYVEIGM